MLHYLYYTGYALYCIICPVLYYLYYVLYRLYCAVGSMRSILYSAVSTILYSLYSSVLYTTLFILSTLGRISHCLYYTVLSILYYTTYTMPCNKPGFHRNSAKVITQTWEVDARIPVPAVPPDELGNPQLCPVTPWSLRFPICNVELLLPVYLMEPL